MEAKKIVGTFYLEPDEHIDSDTVVLKFKTNKRNLVIDTSCPEAAEYVQTGDYVIPKANEAGCLSGAFMVAFGDIKCKEYLKTLYKDRDYSERNWFTGDLHSNFYLQNFQLDPLLFEIQPSEMYEPEHENHVPLKVAFFNSLIADKPAAEIEYSFYFAKRKDGVSA